MLTSKNAVLEIKNKLNLNDDQSNELANIVEPFYDFQKFMKDKYGLEEDECEVILEKYVQKEIIKIDLNTLKSDSEILNMSSSILLDFAKNKGYSKPDDIKNSFISLMNFMNKFNKTEIES